MASVTTTVAAFADNLVQAQVVYDDVTLVISQVQIINNSTSSCTMYISRAGTVLRDLTVAAGGNTSRNVPKGIGFTLDALNEMTLGDLVIGARFG